MGVRAVFVASAAPAAGNPHHPTHGPRFGSARSTKRIRRARLPHQCEMEESSVDLLVIIHLVAI